MKKIINTITAFLLLVLLSFQLHAKQTASYVQDVLNFELVTYQLTTEFNMLKHNEVGQDFNDLKKVLDSGDALSVRIDPNGKDLKPAWDKYRAYAWSKRADSQGETDVYIFNDMRALQNEVDKVVEALKKNLSLEMLTQIDKEKLESLLLLDQMSAEYAELSAAAFGVFAFTGERSVKLNGRVELFDKKLESFKALVKNNSKAKSTLRKAALRWKFIKKTILTYTDRTAPFVVVKTIKKIKSELQSV